MHIKQKALVLAYYLPQFHEVEENNLWWGKGFTEWNNLRDSKIYFKNQQIRRPIEPLGEYDLMIDNKIVEKQFQLANEHGVDGFLVWNYWFGNEEKILEKPIEKVLIEEQQVNFAFAWANHSWVNRAKRIVLKEQKYLGVDDYIKYFEYLKPYFLSEKYIKKDNKPIFSIFMPSLIPDLTDFMDVFNKCAKEIGFDGIFWLAENSNKNNDYIDYFDRYCDSALFMKGRKYKYIEFFLERLNSKSLGKINFGPFIYDYENLMNIYKSYNLSKNELGVIFAGWDTGIRHAKNGTIFKNFNDSIFEKHVEDVFKKTDSVKSDIVVLKSWNEWAEGNLLEPDSIFGYKLLEILKKFKFNNE